MEDDQRSFQPSRVFLTRVETGKERFSRDGGLSAPPIVHWRNNLTGLSQRYNLYFVANQDVVSVYQPSFPFQRLGNSPKLTVPATLAEPKAKGYLDPRRPHCINHLVIGDLGTEEILLVATDSGNVAAYHTKTIRDAIKKDPYAYSKDARSDLVGVRAFFSHWVRESAWGLAIHKNARMIAVSANTEHHWHSGDGCAKITVFAFALTTPDAPLQRKEADESEETTAETSAGSDWSIWTPDIQHEGHGDRTRNLKIVLSGHINNIPSISFVNSDEDREGSWLLSTDIDGQMILWMIWTPQILRQHYKGSGIYRSWDLSDVSKGSGSLGHRQIDRGWSVMALDPAAFLTVHSMEEFCGWTKAPRYHLAPDLEESYNISNIVRSKVPRQSQFHPAFDVDDSTTSDGEDASLSDSAWSEEDIILNEHRGPELESDDESDGYEGAPDTAGAAEDTDVGEESIPMDSLQDDLDGGIPPEVPGNALEAIQTDQLDEAGSVQESEDSGVDPSGYMSPEDDSPSHHDYLTKILEKQKQHEHHDSVVFLPGERPCLPILHCSTLNVRLLQGPTAAAPHFFCAEPLKQLVPPAVQHSGLWHLDRLNLVHSIPELGIVIIATQIGRCAVCSLTRKGKGGPFGVRVDWTLPFREQEKQHQRPNAPLLGLAVGPIQGREIGPYTSMSETDSVPDDSEALHFGGKRTVEGPHVDKVSLSSGTEPKSRSEQARLKEVKKAAAINPKRKRGSPSKKPQPLFVKAAVESERRFTPERGFRPEGWRGFEYSRRYRLMMTYYDHTVLTYEIGRMAPNIGIMGRRNFRNRD